MIRPRVILLVIAGAIVLMALAIGAGNIEIRRVRSGNDIVVVLSEPVVPGVGTVVRWEALAGLPNQPVEFRIRDTVAEQSFGQARLRDGKATVFFPCTIASGSANLLMVSVSTGALLHQTPVDLLPPGPDCLRK